MQIRTSVVEISKYKTKNESFRLVQIRTSVVGFWRRGLQCYSFRLVQIRTSVVAKEFLIMSKVVLD